MYMCYVLVCTINVGFLFFFSNEKNLVIAWCDKHGKIIDFSKRKISFLKCSFLIQKYSTLSKKHCPPSLFRSARRQHFVADMHCCSCAKREGGSHPFFRTPQIAKDLIVVEPILRHS